MSGELVSIPVPGTDRAIMATDVNGKPMVSLRHACEAIGIAFDAQRVKLTGKSWASVTMIVTQLPGDTQRRDDELIHRALEVSARRIAALTEKVAELEPKAEVADKFLDADGDLSVRDAAQALTRAGVKVGQNRLFGHLDRQCHWISRSVDGRYRVLQAAIESGYMSVLPQSHYHPRTGVLVLDAPQPRVTPKGLQRLLRELGGSA